MENLFSLLQRRIWLVPVYAILLLLVGLGLGFALGYYTTEFKPSSDDIAAAADSYSINNNKDLAKQRLHLLSKSELETKINAMIRDDNVNGRNAEAQRLALLGQALGLSLSAVAVITPSAPTSASSVPTPVISGTAATASSWTSNLLLVVALLVLFLIVVGAGWVLYTRVLPQLQAGKPKASPPKTSTAAMPRPMVKPGQAPRAMQGPRVVQPPRHTPVALAPAPAPVRPAAPPPAPAPSPAPAPAPAPAQNVLGKFVATYTLGNDNYDTSFSLETARQEFLGECGMGISETIGEGKPDKVTAFDLWLFDKADVRTVTQILMTEHAFNDPTLRTKLSAKGQLVLAEKGTVVELETQSLRLKAQVTELVYATNSDLAPNSHFEKLVVDILPMLKEPMPA